MSRSHLLQPLHPEYHIGTAHSERKKFFHHLYSIQLQRNLAIDSFYFSRHARTHCNIVRLRVCHRQLQLLNNDGGNEIMGHAYIDQRDYILTSNCPRIFIVYGRLSLLLTFQTSKLFPLKYFLSRKEIVEKWSDAAKVL